MKNLAESIISRNHRLLAKLINSNRVNTDAIALILCETYFNRKLDLYLEYLAMPVLYIFNRQRFKEISIGVAQIKISHWMLRLKSHPLAFGSFLEYFSVNSNYDLVQDLVEGFSVESSSSSLIARYTGESRRFHLDLFEEIKKQLASLVV